MLIFLPTSAHLPSFITHILQFSFSLLSYFFHEPANIFSTFSLLRLAHFHTCLSTYWLIYQPTFNYYTHTNIQPSSSILTLPRNQPVLFCFPFTSLQSLNTDILTHDSLFLSSSPLPSQEPVRLFFSPFHLLLLNHCAQTYKLTYNSLFLIHSS